MDKSTRPDSLMSMEQVKALIHEAGRYINPKFRMPRITFTGNRRKSWGSDGSIRLANFGRHEAVVLHELAHALQPNHTTAWHGPEFAGIYIALVAKFLHQDARSLRDSALRAGLRVGAIPYLTDGQPEPVFTPYYNAYAAAATSIGVKKCSRCDAEKSLEEFANDRSAKNGKYSQCKACEKAIRDLKRRS